MNIKNQPTIINFLKSVSAVFQDSGNEIVIHCPYCDDALRKDAQKHGHLYISTMSPVFHCFRCDISGFLGVLLKDLGFDDQSVLNELGGSLKFSSKKNSAIGLEQKNNQIYNNILLKNLNFVRGDPVNYEKFERYVYSRLGMYCDYTKYLMTPEIINKKLCASFYNCSGNFTTARIINPINNFRYIRNKNFNDYYYFQKLDFDTYKNIVISEGVFDILSLYRFSIFPKQLSFFLAIHGKGFPSAISSLIETHLMIGSYNIHVIFDRDAAQNVKKYLYFCKKIANKLNNEINIIGYIPGISNDAGEFPIIEKV